MLIFSFNDVIYQQTDGIAMRSPFDLALAKLAMSFVGHTTFLLAMSQSSSIHFVNPLCITATWRTSSMCLTLKENVIFSWNHIFLQFTFEKECNQSLPFLDVNG